MIGIDWMFFVKYMLQVDQWLYYCNVDVLSIKEFFWWWYLCVFFQVLVKDGGYCVFVDILELICEFWYYWEVVFVDELGFFSDEVCDIVICMVLEFILNM